jgi:hypothetical protein
VVVDAEAARGVGGVKGAVLGAAEVMSATKLSEAGDEGAAWVLAVGPPIVAI